MYNNFILFILISIQDIIHSLAQYLSIGMNSNQLTDLSQQSNTSQIQRQIKQLQQQNNKLIQSNKQIQTNINTYKSLLKHKQGLIQQKQQQQKSLINKVSSLKVKLDYPNYQVNNHIQQNIQQKSINQKPRQYLQYFNRSILNIDNSKYIQWLVNQLELNTKRKIRATKPLYSCQFQRNYHILDLARNVPNIVVIVKLQNGQIIACYSAPAITKHSNCEYQQGYIFGIVNQKVFRLKDRPNLGNKKHPKPVIYDQFYLIWGNSQFRMRQGTKQIYSNVGFSNSFYKLDGNQNASIVDLFMQNDRELLRQEYQFFEVQFEQ